MSHNRKNGHDSRKVRKWQSNPVSRTELTEEKGSTVLAQYVAIWAAAAPDSPRLPHSTDNVSETENSIFSSSESPTELRSTEGRL